MKNCWGVGLVLAVGLAALWAEAGVDMYSLGFPLKGVMRYTRRDLLKPKADWRPQPLNVSEQEFYPFCDRFGQFRYRDWPGKVKTERDLMLAREEEETWLREHPAPRKDLDRFGGWTGGERQQATGFFRVAKSGGRWQFVDPDGYPFFSFGVVSVRRPVATMAKGRENYFEDASAAQPDGKINLGERNLVLKYGKAAAATKMAELAVRRLSAWGFNTLGNWSDRNCKALAKLPYVDCLETTAAKTLVLPSRWNGRIVDVFDESFARVVEGEVEKAFARSGDDPMCIGWFSDNELKWGADETELAKAALAAPEEQAARKKLLSMFGANPSEAEMRKFCCAFADAYYGTVAKAIRQRAPHRLYLGSRVNRRRVNDAVWEAAAEHCDVISANWYVDQPIFDLPKSARERPLLISEFHFGALDRGSLLAGMVAAENQAERAEKFRRYVRMAVSSPAIVGAHWFSYRDQPLTGRVADGEAFQSGLVDVCDRPYPEMRDAARQLACELYAKKEMDVWFADSCWKVPLHGQPQEIRSDRLSVALAANEAEAVQLVVTTEDEATEVTIGLSSALKNAAGDVLPTSCVEILRERYIRTTEPSTKKQKEKLDDYADPLPPAKFPMTLVAGQNHPFWLRVKAPRDARPGTYRGTVKVNDTEHPLEVEVFGFVLPDVMTCKTLFGFQPKLVDKYHSLDKLKIADRQRVYDLYYKAMSDYHFSVSAGPTAGGKQWSVTWENEEPRFNWKAWDEAMAKGFDEYHFNAFSILSALGLGGCSDTGFRKGKIGDVEEGDPRYEPRFAKLVGGIESHLKKKGWLDRCYVRCYDEPRPEMDAFVCAGFARLAKYAPGLQRLLTVWARESLVGAPTIWCPTAQRFNDPLAIELRKKGETFWMYACMFPRPPYATIFIDHPSIEPRVWLWQCQKEKCGGALMWAVNFWTADSAYPDPARPQNPYVDAAAYNRKGKSNCNGDGRFFYPPESVFENVDARDGKLCGVPCFEPPVGSIRGEMLRDGLEDYEYFEVLRRLDPKNPLLAVPEDVTKSLTEFSVSPKPMRAHRHRLATEISRILKDRKNKDR